MSGEAADSTNKDSDILKDTHPEEELKSILITNLSRNVNSSHLLEIFSNYGELLNVDLHLDPKIGLAKGSAELVYKDSSGAKKAFKYMNGGQLDGKIIKIVIIEPPNKPIPKPAYSRENNRGGRGRSPVGRRQSPPRGGGSRIYSGGSGGGRRRSRSASPRGSFRRPSPRRRSRSPIRRSRSPPYRRRNSRSRSRSFRGRARRSRSRSRSRSDSRRRVGRARRSLSKSSRSSSRSSRSNRDRKRRGRSSSRSSSSSYSRSRSSSRSKSRPSSRSSSSKK